MYIFRIIPAICILTYICLPIHAQIKEIWTYPLKKCWEYRTENMSRMTIASDNERTVFLPKTDGKLEAVDIRTGKPLWSTEIGGDFSSELRLFGNRLYIASRSSDGYESNETDRHNIIRVINPTTGIIESTLETDLPGTLGLYRPDTHLYAVSSEGQIRSYTPDLGADRNIKFDFSVTTELIRLEDRLVFGTSNKTIVFIDAFGGRIKSQLNLKGIPTRLSISPGGYLYAGDSEGNIYKINPSGKDFEWFSKVGGKISDLNLSERNLLISSDDNFSYLISNEDGGVIWKRKLAGRILGKSLLNEAYAAYAAYGSDVIMILSLENGKPVNSVSFGTDLFPVSSPVRVGNKLIIPLSSGLYGFDPLCQ